MTTRADMIETAANALHEQRYGWGLTPEHEDVADLYREEAQAVLDAVLPQITTVEQFKAVPGSHALLGERDGYPQLFIRRAIPTQLLPNYLERFGPLTVIWQPNPKQDTTP